MAEQTPGSLGGLGAGFFLGRATNNNKNLDHVVDRFERSVDRFSDALDKVVQGAGSATTSNAGFTTQSRAPMGNGGNVSFGGVTSHAPSSHRADVTEPKWTGGGGGGSHRGNGGGWSFGGGGDHAAPPGSSAYHAAGGRSGIATKAGVAALGGLAVYTANHASSQTTNQAIASQFSSGRDYMGAYRSAFGGNYTAVNAKDASMAGQMQLSQGGFTAGSAGFRSMQQNTQGMSLIDPTISNTAAMQASMSLASVGSFNRMRALGIRTVGSKGGTTDIMSIARQIISKMGGRAPRTDDELNANMGINGPVEITMNSMIANGYMPAEAAGPVKAAIRAIWKAQMGGMTYEGLRANMGVYQTNPDSEAGKAALGRLRDVGIGNSNIRSIRQNEGKARDSEVATVKGFSEGLQKTTGVLEDFRDALNKILNIPGVGRSVGWGSGVMSSAGSILSKIPGPWGKLMGTGPASMSSSAMMFASASGGDGPANMASSASSYGGATGKTSGGAASTGSARATSQSYSLGPVKPWVAKAASILGTKFGIGTIGGYGARSTPSDHPKGLALDFMCSKSQGDRLAPYAVANHKALNITYVIWRQRIWSINNPSWKMMEDRGSVTANHYDHVHISFLASPTNGDFGNLPGAGSGTGLGSSGTASAVGTQGHGSGGLGAGASSPDNGGSIFTATSSGSVGSSYGGFSEAAALGLGGGGPMVAGIVAMSGGGVPAGSGGGRVTRGSGGSGSAGGQGSGVVVGSSTVAGTATGNQAIGRTLAGQRGWTGAQWDALKRLWQNESGWRTDADNPTSSAYGIPQALLGLHDVPMGYYYNKSGQGSGISASGGDPAVQIQWGLNYIAGRYGNPKKALDFWNKNNYYAKGSWNVRADQDAQVHQGEMILPAKVADEVRNALSGSGRGGGTGASIVFQSGAIVVKLSGPVTPHEAKVTGHRIVEAVLEDRRMKQLAEGG